MVLMAVQFLYPGFLLALSAISIPIIIHLFNFRKFKKVYFTNVKFLKEVKQETQSKSKLKHLLILFSRILAISFLVLAFSQPFIPSKGGQKMVGDRITSIYIDNSFSMDAVNESGSLLNEAKKKALEILSAYATTDRFQLLTNDFEGRHQRLINKEEFEQFLDEVSLSPAVKNTAEIISRQKDLLNSSSVENKSIFLLSDFQKSITVFDELKNDSNIHIHMIPLLAQKRSNVFIDSIWFSTPVRQYEQKEDVSVRLKNFSEEPIENNSIKLFINGQQKTPASFNISENGENTIVLSYTGNETGIQHGRIEINDYPISFDDQFFFSYKVAKEIKVLNIYQEKQQLEIPIKNHLKALFGKDSLFVYKEISDKQLDYSMIPHQDMIVLNELEKFSSGLTQEIKRFVENGGNIFVLPASTADLESYNQLLNNVEALPLLTLDTNNTKVDRIDFEHIIFRDIFEKKSEQLDLPKVNAHYKISKSSFSKEEVLMKLENDDSFLSVFEHGKGKVYLSAVPLMNTFSNLQKHALFVPIMYKAATYSQPQLPLYYTINKDVLIEIPNTDISGENTFHLKNTERDVIPEHRVRDNKTIIFVHDQIKTAGNYLLNAGDAVNEGIAFNYDRSESNTSCYTPEDMEALISKNKLNNIKVLNASVIDIGKTISEINQGKKLWKLCIILTLLFLAIEILLLRFWK